MISTDKLNEISIRTKKNAKKTFNFAKQKSAYLNDQVGLVFESLADLISMRGAKELSTVDGLPILLAFHHSPGALIVAPDHTARMHGLVTRCRKALNRCTAFAAKQALQTHTLRIESLCVHHWSTLGFRVGRFVQFWYPVAT